MDDLRTQQKTEALNRLRILQMKYGLMENVINEFDKEDVIYYSEYINSTYNGILYWVSNNNEYVELIKELEKKKNILVYHAIETPTIYGTRFTLLYVSSSPNEWKRDRDELNDGLPIAYCINLADKEMAEFGGVQIAGANGGIIQTA